MSKIQTDWLGLAINILAAIAISWFFYWLAQRRTQSRGAGRPRKSRIPASGSVARTQGRLVLTLVLAVAGMAGGAFWLFTHGLPGSAVPVTGSNGSPSEASGDASSHESAPGPGDTPSTEPPAVERESISVTVNGFLLPEKGFAEGDRVMVPTRPVFLAYAVETDFNQETSKITLMLHYEVSWAVIGSTSALARDTAVTLNYPPVIKEGVAYVPLEFCAKALDLPTAFDPETQMAAVGVWGSPSAGGQGEGHLSGYQPLITFQDLDAAKTHAREYARYEDLIAPYERTFEDEAWPVRARAWLYSPWLWATSSAWCTYNNGFPDPAFSFLGPDDAIFLRTLYELRFCMWIPQRGSTEWHGPIEGSLIQGKSKLTGGGGGGSAPEDRIGSYDGSDWYWGEFELRFRPRDVKPSGVLTLEVIAPDGTALTFNWDLSTIR